MLDESMPELVAKIKAFRRDIHAHPELAFKEERTAQQVAAGLQALGLEVHRGLATTGVVARLSVGTSRRAIRARCTPAVTTDIRRCCSVRRNF